MARYTIHVPARAVTREGALERAIFVRDGWSWGAFAFGPLWLLWHRHLVIGLVLLVLSAGLAIGLRILPLPEWTTSGISFALMVLFGLEGSSLRRLALGFAGFADEGIVVGDDRDTLERRYFDEALVENAAQGMPVPPRGAGVMPAPSGAVLGLFPDPRKHP